MNRIFASLMGIAALLCVNTIHVEAEDAVKVTGALISQDGTPAASYSVYLVHVAKGIVVWDCAEDLITIRNPTAKTDADGKFTVSATRNFIERKPGDLGGSAAEDDDGGAIGLTLILVPPGGKPMHDGLRPADKDGRRRLFCLDLGTNRTDVGKLNVGSTKNPAASGRRTPSMWPRE